MSWQRTDIALSAIRALVAGVFGVNNNGTGVGVYGQANVNGGVGVFGEATGGTSSSALYGHGDLAVTGNKSALVPAEDGYLRKLYCLESPECWFEDFGTAQLVNGSAHVTIEPLFAATIHTDQYHIFLSPSTSRRALWCRARTSSQRIGTCFGSAVVSFGWCDAGKRRRLWPWNTSW